MGRIGDALIPDVHKGTESTGTSMRGCNELDVRTEPGHDRAPTRAHDAPAIGEAVVVLCLETALAAAECERLCGVVAESPAGKPSGQRSNGSHCTKLGAVLTDTPGRKLPAQREHSRRWLR